MRDKSSANFLVMKRFAMTSRHGLSFYHVTQYVKRTYLSMGVVKLDDAPNWDVERMAKGKPYGTL